MKENNWIWEVDKDGTYTYVGPNIEGVLGYKPDEVIGKTPFDLMPTEESVRIKSTFKNIVENSQPIVALKNLNQHKEGQSIILETNGVPFFDDTGNITHYRGFDLDVTGMITIPKEALEAREKIIGMLSSFLNRAATQSEEEQRKSIASDLHDGVVQTLALSTSKLKTIRESDVGENTTEQALKKTIDTLEQKVKEKTVDLEEMNIALKVLFKKIDEDKKNLEKQTLSGFSNLILPYLSDLAKTNMDSRQQALLSIIEGNVTEVISPISNRFASSSFGLTLTEIKIANLIKYGKKSKEIAEILNLSPRTIDKYRERIRYKLSIQNKKVNLQAYLSSLH